jgi:hypothetical protein
VNSALLNQLLLALFRRRGPLLRMVEARGKIGGGCAFSGDDDDDVNYARKPALIGHLVVACVEL